MLYIKEKIGTRLRDNPVEGAILALTLVYETPKIFAITFLTHWYEHLSLEKFVFTFPDFHASIPDAIHTGHHLMEYSFPLIVHAWICYLATLFLMARVFSLIKVPDHSEHLMRMHVCVIVSALMSIPDRWIWLAIYIPWGAILVYNARERDWTWYLRMLHVHTAVKIMHLLVEIAQRAI